MPLELIIIEHAAHPEQLTQPAESVTFPLSVEDSELIAQMKKKVLQLNGVGLAAPQIGVSKQIIVYVISEDAKGIRQDANEVIPVTVLLNPSYVPTKDAEIVYDWEACFSVNNTTGKVPRYSKIHYTAKTLDGSTIEATVQGFTARVLQHEIDHIQGILITHRLTPDCVQGHPNDMMALRISELSATQRDILSKMIHQREENLKINKKNM